MKKFLVIYHIPKDAAWQPEKATPEQIAEGMKLWEDWARNCGNKLIDTGSPLANSIVLGPNGESKNSNASVAGFSILEAENMDEVISLLKGNPHLSGWSSEATIEVHESMDAPGK
jgi:hypothetical protein